MSPILMNKLESTMSVIMVNPPDVIMMFLTYGCGELWVVICQYFHWLYYDVVGALTSMQAAWELPSQ